MLTYILETTLCWAGFYLLYVLLLRRETFFGLNRWYLLGTLVLGLLIPLIEWPNFTVDDNPAVVYLAPISVGVHQIELTVTAVSEQPEAINWMQILTYLYWLGVSLFTVRFGIGLAKIFKLYQAGKKVRSGDLCLVYTDNYHLPFSFFNRVFWSKSFEAAHEEKLHILRHEEAHVSGWHTLDVLALEVLGIFLWCSPMIYFYRASLKTIHEYLADAAVLQTTQRKIYGKLLLKQSMSGLQLALTHQFFHSQLKDRIIMMTRTKSRKEAIVKYLPLIPLLALAIMLVSNEDAMAKLQEQQAAVEQMFFTGNFNKEKVSQQFAEAFNQENEEAIQTAVGKLYKQVRAEYPENGDDIRQILREEGKRRGYRPTFLVKNDDLIALPKLKNETFGSFDIEKVRTTFREALKNGADHDTDKVGQIWAQLRAENPNHILAINKIFAQEFERQGMKLLFKGNYQEVFLYANTNVDGKTLKLIDSEGVTKTYPLKDFNQLLPESVTGWHTESMGEIYVININIPFSEYTVNNKTYQSPIFSGCENAEDPQACSQKKLIEFVYKNIRYPAAARAEGVQGTVVISYNITAEGEVTNVQAGRSVSPELDEEVMRVVRMMPRWTPGKNENGEPTSYGLTLPVRYKLEGDNGEGDNSIFQSEQEQQITELYDSQMFVVVGYGAPKINDEIFKVVEEMPLFPGCEEMTAYSQDKKKCADRELLEFIYQNLKYPKTAIETGVEGVVVVQFIIDKAGNIRQPQIARSIGGGTDEEVLRVVNLMPKWIPGKQSGENVNVQFNLPVRFKLDGEETEKIAQSVEQEITDEIFKVVEEMPRFGGSTDYDDSNKKLVEFVYQNLKYPEIAKKAGVEGTAVVQFVISKTGDVLSPKIVRSIGGDTDEEVLRVVQLMPNWIPGKQGGRNVNVQFNLPVRFVLPKGDSNPQLSTNNAPPAINNLQLTNFTANPNPTDGDLNIRFEAEAQALTLTILDVTGKQIFRQELKDFDGLYQQQIDLRKAAKGVVFITIQQGDKVFTEQVILQ